MWEFLNTAGISSKSFEHLETFWHLLRSFDALGGAWELWTPWKPFRGHLEPLAAI